MASQHSSSLLILSLSISLFLTLLITPTHSLTCKSQKLPENRTYANCTDLPALSATLHFTYNATNRSLSIAFAAAPPTSSGWVAWGVNPTGPMMIGTQALIAFKHDNGNIAVDPYNLSSYSGVNPVKKLSIDTWDIAAEESNGAITIFAGVKVPEKADNLSQVWQVGPVANWLPVKHAFAPQNLAAKAALPVEGTTLVSSNSSESGNGTSSGNSTNDGDKSGGALVMGERLGMRFCFGLVLVLVGFLSM